MSAGRWGLTAAALAVVLLGAACGDTEDGGDGGDATDATTTVTASVPTSTSTAAATSTAASESTTTSTAAATETAEATSAATSTAEEGATVSLGGNDELGEFLVGPAGMTLYIFTNDEPGVSNCTGGCAENWPPLTVESDEVVGGEGVTGELDVIEREDGSTQVTYDGAPLYYWANDSAPGEATGHEVGGVWFVARVDGSTASSAPAGGSSPGDPGY